MRARQTFLHKSEWAAEIALLKQRGVKNINASQDPVQDYVSRLWHTEYSVSYDTPEGFVPISDVASAPARPEPASVTVEGAVEDAIQPTSDGTSTSTVGHA